MKKFKTKWSEVKDKEEKVYMPILNAYVKELKKLEDSHPIIVPQNFLGYLLGNNDYYKVISKDSKKITQISVFNLHGTLNKSSGKIKPQTVVPKLILPTKFYDISYKKNSKNTVIATCDNGWTISMRIHNASTLVEPILKFDVNLTGIPHSLYTQYEPW